MKRPFLIPLIVTCVAALAAYALYPPPPLDATAPEDLAGQAQWLREHPADWLTVTRVADGALDSAVRSRFALWHASHALAMRLAPNRANVRAAFVRSGLFHWYELPDADKKRVLQAAEPMLRDMETFRDLYKPLWELTGNFALLRRVNPGIEEALVPLRDLAVTNGLFDDYRALRTEVRRKRLAEFESRQARMSSVQIVQFLPLRFEKADEPLLRRALDELHRRPLGENPERGDTVNAMIEYALRHDLKPLDGLEAITRLENSASPALRAALARELGLADRAANIDFQAPRGGPQPTSGWQGLCGTDVCYIAHRTFVATSPRQTLRITTVQTDEVPPYVEVLLDDALVDEAPVPRSREVALTLTPGKEHRVEVRIANPLTRNRIQRRVRVD